MKVRAVAKVAHEANRGYCEALGDYSQPPWELAPGWQIESAIKGVEFHLSHPDASPAASHESWLAQKLRDGWTWGPRKDPDAKTHPCIVSFEQLPRDQQAKDHLFRGIVHALAPFVDDGADDSTPAERPPR
jgi:hypothetical protein